MNRGLREVSIFVSSCHLCIISKPSESPKTKFPKMYKTSINIHQSSIYWEPTVYKDVKNWNYNSKSEKQSILRRAYWLM